MPSPDSFDPSLVVDEAAIKDAAKSGLDALKKYTIANMGDNAPWFDSPSSTADISVENLQAKIDPNYEIDAALPSNVKRVEVGLSESETPGGFSKTLLTLENDGNKVQVNTVLTQLETHNIIELALGPTDDQNRTALQKNYADRMRKILYQPVEPNGLDELHAGKLLKTYLEKKIKREGIATPEQRSLLKEINQENDHNEAIYSGDRKVTIAVTDKYDNVIPIVLDDNLQNSLEEQSKNTDKPILESGNELESPGIEGIDIANSGIRSIGDSEEKALVIRLDQESNLMKNNFTSETEYNWGQNRILQVQQPSNDPLTGATTINKQLYTYLKEHPNQREKLKKEIENENNMKEAGGDINEDTVSVSMKNAKPLTQKNPKNKEDQLQL